ncbi:hypothetical protein [Streptomyces prunicolor]|uniref:hypothetical protein n=1 Tax=Streptomyces prunicolor TaxID=67348 RepID=UPI00039C9B2B|nr:hypothetical protein [Streptomyces prunicolor]
MEIHPLSPDQQQPAVDEAPTRAHSDLDALPYEELERILRVFTDPQGPHPDSRVPAPYLRLTPDVQRLLADQMYMARVRDLTLLEEQRLQQQRGQLAAAPQYLELPASTAPPQKAPAAAVPAFVWKYSVIALSTGGGIALAGYGVGAAAPGLAVVDDILTAAGQFVMWLAVLAVALGLVVFGRGSSKSTGGSVINIRKAVFKRNRFKG